MGWRGPKVRHDARLVVPTSDEPRQSVVTAEADSFGRALASILQARSLCEPFWILRTQGPRPVASPSHVSRRQASRWLRSAGAQPMPDRRVPTRW